ncbi:hypothetical protein BEP19_01545 [Ammoniphilus oxalaticus]|uniref:Rhodanese domain-containing protein n=1 Tax=Ammoniphilus oxalaticus TaxID=66863 RepID=A0A419SN23_9BACL|nr:sulfurtransferase TusA family protein [Ammoniphilus oxalaticus]RKD25653.1 hypothetical protein BEP19_01545 [Ammoniphilus oxalaticus]
MNLSVDKMIDAKQLACPMPIVRTKQAVEKLEPGQVLEVQATDKGSIADLQGWTKSAGHHYLGMKEKEGVFRHFLRKADPNEEKQETIHPQTITNEALQAKLEKAEALTIIDVREQAEFLFGHLPTAISIPMGVLEGGMDQFDHDQPLFIICRTGNRSDRACQLLTELGFKNVTNVLPGMSQWTGPIEKE